MKLPDYQLQSKREDHDRLNLCEEVMYKLNAYNDELEARIVKMQAEIDKLKADLEAALEPVR